MGRSFLGLGAADAYLAVIGSNADRVGHAMTTLGVTAARPHGL